MESPAPTSSSSWWVLSGGVVLGLVTGGPLAIVCHQMFAADFPLSATCSLAALWWTTRRARATLPAEPHRAFMMALGASGVAACVAFWMWIIHAERVWVQSTGFRPCGNVALSFPFLAFASLLLAVHLVEGVARTWRRPLLRLLPTSVPLLALALAALSCMGVARRASHPAPSERFNRLAVVSTLVVSSDADLPVGDITLTVRRVEPGYTGSNAYYHVLLRRSPQAPLPPPRVGERRAMVAHGDSIQVLRDRRHDLWIVQRSLLHADPYAIVAFRGPTLARVNLGLRDYPGEYAPFIGWPVAALLGVALAAWLARRPRFVDPLPPGPLADGTLAADGTLLLADGSTRPASPGTAAPAGPVVVAASHAAAPYRDNAPVAVVRAGTLARWTDALRDERDVRHALAFSTLVLLGTPMLFAAWLRLLW